ncbi:hypothetical protein Daesc_003676 [Daldinia eschscholtzii]|uniref:Uncharacterized protein n=1 Tax=Daldinia eschscholtzii TaxID=292717 RepID=A0AAX6MTS7_9PEZI
MARRKSNQVQVQAGFDFHFNIPSDLQNVVQALLPSAEIDALWTQQDELDLRRSWDADPLKPHVLDSRGNKQTAPLLRYTLRFMDIPAEEIVGPRFNLACDTSSNQTISIVSAGGREVPHPHWSARFCEKLAHLVSHPMWLSQPGALATCLQYVVKCRTNDQRRMSWPSQNYTDHKFLDIFQVVNSTFQDGTMSVVELHDEVERRMNGIPSPYSRLFRTIEDVACGSEDDPLRQPGDSGLDIGTYLVNTEDLSALIEALDAQIDVHGFHIHRPAEYTAVAAKAAKKSYDLPRANDIAAVRERVLLGIRRFEARAAKIAAQPHPYPHPHPGQDNLTAAPVVNVPLNMRTQTAAEAECLSARREEPPDSDDPFAEEVGAGAGVGVGVGAEEGSNHSPASLRQRPDVDVDDDDDGDVYVDVGDCGGIDDDDCMDISADAITDYPSPHGGRSENLTSKTPKPKPAPKPTIPGLDMAGLNKSPVYEQEVQVARSLHFDRQSYGTIAIGGQYQYAAKGWNVLR